MKRVLIASLMLVSSVFGYRDVFDYADSVDIAKYGKPMLGDLQGYHHDIVGQLTCRDGVYKDERNVVNLNIGYKDIMSRKLGNAEGNEVCRILNSKNPNIEIRDSIMKNGRLYDIDSDGYNNFEAPSSIADLPGCKLIHATAIEENGKQHDFVYRVCYTTDIADPAARPSVVNYNPSESPYKYATKLMESAKEWNDRHINKFSGVWLDMKEERARYNGDELRELIKNAEYLGDYVDGEGNYLFSIKPGDGKTLVLGLGDAEYNIDFDLNHIKDLREQAKLHLANLQNIANTTWQYECHMSEKGKSGKSDVVGYIVRRVNGLEIYRYIALNPTDKTGNKYSCKTESNGMQLDTNSAGGIIVFTNATLIPPAVRSK